MDRSIRILSATVLLASLAVSNSARAEGETPEKAATLVVYGEDPCPKSKDDEIVVCSRKPESERYRIPKALRERNIRPSETSWASRFNALEEETRFTRPNSCSVVGTGGQTGCLEMMIRQWRAERRALQDEAYAP